MMATTLFENRNLTISYHADRGYLFLQWNGSLTSEDFRTAGHEIIKAIEKTKGDSILSDNTHWKVISPNDHGWAAYNWFPEAEAKGVKRLATVSSSDYFNRSSEKTIVGMAEVNCMDIRNFKTTAAALKWLTESKVANCN